MVKSSPMNQHFKSVFFLKTFFYLGGLSFLPANFFSLYALLSRLDFLPYVLTETTHT